MAFEWHRCWSLQTKQKGLFLTQTKWRWICVRVLVCAHAYVCAHIMHARAHTTASPRLYLFSDIITKKRETAQYSLIICSQCLTIAQTAQKRQMCSACQMRSTVHRLSKRSVQTGAVAVWPNVMAPPVARSGSTLFVHLHTWLGAVCVPNTPALSPFSLKSKMQWFRCYMFMYTV